MQDKSIPVPVLNDDFTKPINLVTAYSVDITEKKETSRLIKQLGELFPLTGRLPHIKRVRCCPSSQGKQLQILICTTDQVGDDSSYTTVDEIFLKQPDFDKSGLGKLTCCKVPRDQPKTRAQFDVAQTYWPSAYHEDKELSRLLNGTFFSKSEVQSINSVMKTALDVAARRGETAGALPIGAVIFSPDSREIVASCYDLREGSLNPLHHAVMVCIDLVARSQGGGAWNIQNTPGFYWRKPTTVALQPDNFSLRKADQTTYLEGSASPGIDNTNHSCQSSTIGHHHNADNNDKQKGLKRRHEEDEVLPPSYLCTGLELYVTREPCVMCAMALVHSRIKRVYYAAPHPDGALGSRYMIHCQPGLNHHFQVFKGVLEEECKQLDSGVT